MLYNKSQTKKLTEEERDSLTIRISVQDGSILDIFKFDELIKRAIDKMDSKDITKTIRFLAITGCIYGILHTGINSILSYKMRQDDNIASARTLSEYNRLSSMMFDYLSEKDNVEVNGETLSSDRLAAISDKKRALAKDIMDDKGLQVYTFSEEFFVQEFKNTPEFSITFRSRNNGDIYRASLGYESTESIQKLSEHAYHKEKPIEMNITTVKDASGRIETTRINSIEGEALNSLI